MAYEKAGVELELSKAEAYISNAKQAAASTDLLYSSISKLGGVNISSLNAFSSTMKDLVKIGQDAGKSAQQAATQIVEVGTKASASSSRFGDLTGKVKDVTSGFLSLGGSAVGMLVKGLGDIGSMGLSAAKGLLDVGSAAAGAAWSGISKLGSMAVDAGKFLVDLGVKAVEAGAKFAISFGKDAVKAAMDFDKQMSEVAAVSSATPDQLKRMSDEALRLGAVFPVSATDAAKAMTELGKAGFNTDQILAASVGTVQLASATHYSMADSATVLANAINQFGLKASDAGRVTDLLAAAANSSAVDVKDLAKTFEYAGPVAQAAGFSIEDVAKATSVMGNAGIKGSSAGTGLKAVLSSLIAPSDKAAAAFQTLGFKSTDANGKIRPLQDQLVDLRSKFKGLSSQEQVDLATKIVGVNHFSKLLAVMNATDDSFNQVSDSIDKADGAGKRMADTMNDNLAGAVENLKGSFETFQIKVGKALEPVLKDLANLGSLVLNKLTPYVDTFAKKFQDGYKKVAVVSKEVFQSWSLFKASFTSGFTVPPAWTGLAATMARLGEALSPLKQAFSDLMKAILPAPVEKLAASVGLAGSAAKNAHPYIDTISKIVTNYLVPGMEGAAKAVDGFQKAFGKVVDQVKPMLPQLGKLASTAFDIYKTFSPLAIVFDTVKAFFTGGTTAAVSTFTDHLNGIVDALQGLGKGITSWLHDNGANLVKGLGEWSKNLVEWVARAAGPLLVELGNLVVMLLNTIAANAPAILNQLVAWGKSFIDWVAPQIPPLLAALGNLAGSILVWMGQQIGPIWNQLVEWGKQFIDWVGPQIPPLLGKLGELAGQVLGWVGDQIGPLLGQLGKWGLEFVQWVGPKIPGMLAELGKLIGQALNWIGQQVGPILAQLGKWATEFVDWIGPKIPGMLAELGKLAGELIGWVIGEIPVIVGKLAEWGLAFIGWVGTEVLPRLPGVLADILAGVVLFLVNAVGPIVEGIGKWVSGMVDEATKLVTKIPGIIGDMATAAITAIIKFVSDAVGEVGKLPGQIWDVLSGLPAKMLGLGKSMSESMAAGIRAAAGSAIQAAADMAQQAINAAKSRVKAFSPSKVFIEIGHNVGDGFAIGIEDKVPVVAGSMVDLVGNMNKVIKSQSPNLKEAIDKFMLPVSGLPFYLDGRNPVIGRSLIDVWENLALVTDMKSGLVNDAIGRLLQPIKDAAGEIGSLIGTNQDPATPIGQIADHIGTIIGNAARNFAGDIDAYVEALRRLRNEMTEVLNSMPGPPTSGAGGTPLPGQGASNMPLPTGGGQFTFASGTSYFKGGPAIVGEAGPELIKSLSGKLSLVLAPTLFPNLERGSKIFDPAQTRHILASPASPQQISNMYSTTTSNAPTVVNNNQVYQMPLNVAPMQVGSIQQGYAHARAMIPV